MKKLYDWIRYNRFIVIAPTIALVIWFVAIGCTALTPDPMGTGKMIDTAQLEMTFESWKKQQELVAIRFEHAAKDLQDQEDRWSRIQEVIIKLASGSVATWPGLIQLLAGAGFVGAISDNIRKRGLINGLKRNGY